MKKKIAITLSEVKEEKNKIPPIPLKEKILNETKEMDIVNFLKTMDEYHSNVEIRRILNQIIVKKIHLLEKKAKQTFKLQRINLGP